MAGRGNKIIIVVLCTTKKRLGIIHCTKPHGEMENLTRLCCGVYVAWRFVLAKIPRGPRSSHTKRCAQSFECLHMELFVRESFAIDREMTREGVGAQPVCFHFEVVLLTNLRVRLDSIDIIQPYRWKPELIPVFSTRYHLDHERPRNLNKCFNNCYRTCRSHLLALEQ